MSAHAYTEDPGMPRRRIIRVAAIALVAAVIVGFVLVREKPQTVRLPNRTELTFL